MNEIINEIIKSKNIVKHSLEDNETTLILTINNEDKLYTVETYTPVSAEKNEKANKIIQALNEEYLTGLYMYDMKKNALIYKETVYFQGKISTSVLEKIIGETISKTKSIAIAINSEEIYGQ